jgi:hypothetical protein
VWLKCDTFNALSHVQVIRSQNRKKYGSYNK